MTDVVHQFGQINLSSRGGVSQGVFKINSQGIFWKRSGGGKSVDVNKADIDALSWMKMTRGYQLSVRRSEGITLCFSGFREKDLAALDDVAQKAFDLKIEEQLQATSGRTWGKVEIHGASLLFEVDGKRSFEVPLPEVSAAQQARDDVVLEFHVDDTADDKEDTLVGMAFEVPKSHPDYPSAGEEPSAKVLLDSLLQYTEAGSTETDDIVYEFHDVQVVVPRGRFNVEMHLSFLQLLGQTQEFKIRYTNILRVFILPKANSPHTVVVIALDQPIRKGQTFYYHILTQFPTDEHYEAELDITEEQLNAKNEKLGGKLQASVSGMAPDVFAKILRGLSGASITRPKTFRNAAGDGCAVRCSYGADYGFLYPLEQAFFYIQKPTILINYEEVTAVEFLRQEGAAATQSLRTGDLKISVDGGKEYKFQQIQRSELRPLKDFLAGKRLRIEGFSNQPEQRGLALGDDMDPGLRQLGGESDEDEDEDFDAGAESGSGSGSESDSGATGSGSESEGAEMVAETEFGISAEDVGGGGKKRKGGADVAPKKAAAAGAAPKPPSAKKPKKAAAAAGGEGAEGGKPAKKERKKKDPNAPKRGMSAFMFFSNKNRDAVKAENPDIKFTEVAKVLGEKWKALSAEDRVQYETMAKADSQRYAADMAKYRGQAPAAEAEASGEEDAGSS